MSMAANTHYARSPAPATLAEEPGKAPAKASTRAKASAPVKATAKKTTRAKKVARTAPKSKRTATPATAAKRLGKSLTRLAKSGLDTLSSALPLKGKRKPAKKK